MLLHYTLTIQARVYPKSAPKLAADLQQILASSDFYGVPMFKNS